MVTIVQLGDRKISLGGRDCKAEQKEKRVEERIMKEDSRKKQYGGQIPYKTANFRRKIKCFTILFALFSGQ